MKGRSRADQSQVLSFDKIGNDSPFLSPLLAPPVYFLVIYLGLSLNYGSAAAYFRWADIISATINPIRWVFP